jgi:hypothetical protein
MDELLKIKPLLRQGLNTYIMIGVDSIKRKNKNWE